MYIHTDYLEDIYKVNRYQQSIFKLVQAIRKFDTKHTFDAIAFTGTSGAAAAYPLSFILHKPLICIRKDRKNHMGDNYEGAAGIKNYIIVDDFIDSGTTISNVLNITQARNVNAKPLAIFLYKKYYSLKTHFQYEDFNIPIFNVSNKNKFIMAA